MGGTWGRHVKAFTTPRPAKVYHFPVTPRFLVGVGGYPTTTTTKKPLVSLSVMGCYPCGMSRTLIVAIALIAIVVIAAVAQAVGDPGLSYAECVNPRWTLYVRGVYTYDQTVALFAARC